MALTIRNLLKRYGILILLIAIKFVLQYILVNPIYDLHRDEFLYLNQADHLALGYISIPPFLAVVSKLIFMLGGGIFWIRAIPSIFGALTIVFTWLIVESLGGNLFSKILAASALVFSILMRMNMLYQPNSSDILVWIIIFYLLIKLIQSGDNKWLLWLSVIIAIGFYNKYNIVFLIAGLTAGLLLTSQRKIFTNPFFYKALAISLILLMPNIIWQASNHFPVFEHMKVLKKTQLDNNSITGFLSSQILYIFGSIPLVVAAFIALIRFRSFRQYRFIAITFVVVIALFALLKAKGYYAFGIYPVLIAFGSVYFEKIILNNWKYLVFPFLILINIGVFLVTMKTVFPVLTPSAIRQNAGVFQEMGLLRWEDGKNHSLPQDNADMLGWREMAEKSLTAYNMIPKDELKNTLIVCYNYGQAGALNYYNRKKMAEAYSFNTDYIYWLPRLDKIQNILLIGDKPAKELIGMFKNYNLTGVVQTSYAREQDTGIYLLRGANDSFTEIFYKRIEDKKKNLDVF